MFCIQRWLHYWENSIEMVFLFQGEEVQGQRLFTFWLTYFDENQLHALMKEESYQTVRELAQERASALMLLSLIIFTQWVMSCNIAHVCYKHWQRETNSSTPPLLLDYSFAIGSWDNSKNIKKKQTTKHNWYCSHILANSFFSLLKTSFFITFCVYSSKKSFLFFAQITSD